MDLENDDWLPSSRNDEPSAINEWRLFRASHAAESHPRSLVSGPVGIGPSFERGKLGGTGGIQSPPDVNW
jgi:hypothetical protein